MFLYLVNHFLKINSWEIELLSQRVGLWRSYINMPYFPELLTNMNVYAGFNNFKVMGY